MLEILEMAKTKRKPQNSWYQWSEWLINYISESLKKFQSNAKQKVMQFSESKLDNDIPMDY